MYTLGHDSCRRRYTPAGYATTAMRRCVRARARVGLVEARAYRRNVAFDAALQFARTKGILPAPELNHAIRSAIDDVPVGQGGRRAAR